MRPDDIADDEILAALRDTKPDAPRLMSAGDVAHKIWRVRGTNTPSVQARHVKPGLARLVEDGSVQCATGNAAHRIGRFGSNRRNNATYYVLAEFGRAYAASLAHNANLRKQGNHLAKQVLDTLGDRIASADATSNGGVTITLTPEQATALMADLGNRAEPSATDRGYVSIDDAVSTLIALRRQSPLGATTVLHWSEHSREYLPITAIRLETDDDGAVVVLSGPDSGATT